MHISGNVLVGIAVSVVALVLFAGLVNMMRGGSPALSQKLMRWRVGLPCLAVIIIMCVLSIRRS